LMARGAQRHMMYDPAFPEQDNDTVWNLGDFHTIGYALTFPGTAGIMASNLNASIIPKPTSSAYPAPLASERPLLACATLSHGDNTTNRAANVYTGIYGIWGPQRAPHLMGKIPLGGNVGTLDGSVRWVGFAAMIPRTTTGSDPSFWW
jgi:hypothetical protein